MDTRDIVLVCECAFARKLASERVDLVRDALAAKAAHVMLTDDLCMLAARRDERLAKLKEAANVYVLACRPRAARWLLTYAGLTVDEHFTFVDIHADDTVRIEHALQTIKGNMTNGAFSFERLEAGARAWFPVMDADRCKQCGQCLNFCLFGVYAKNENGDVEVRAPLNCKDNCPACARICPEVAIVFPKCPEAPIDGTEVTDDGVQQKRIRLDVEKILGDDPYAALLERRRLARRKKLLRDAEGVVDSLSEARALEERLKYLQEDDTQP